MKMKDIKIGEVYAMGPPNSTYDTPVAVRVTKVKVHGEVGDSWRSGQSTRANYVEYKPIDPKKSGSFRNRTRVYTKTGEIPIGRSFTQRHKEDTVEVFRCQSSNIQRTWVDEEIKRKKDAEVKVKAKVLRDAEHARITAVVNAFKDLGIQTSSRNTWNLEIPIGHAEKLLELIKKGSSS